MYSCCFTTNSLLQIANETVNTWSQCLGDDSIIDLEEEFLTMTLKGVTRTCYGSMFSDEEEVRKMSIVYHKVHKCDVAINHLILCMNEL